MAYRNDDNAGDIDGLFSLLNECCTNGDLRNTLRFHRSNPKDYPLSVNREKLLASLRRLVNSGHLPLRRLEDLLARAEENGRQHIFLFVPADTRAYERLEEFDLVSASLLGGKSPLEAGLPRFLLKPHDVQFSDIRLETRAGSSYSTWTVKLYSGNDFWEREGEPEVREEGNVRIIKMRKKYRRDVLVLKWHSFGLLEVRVPNASRRHVLDTRDSLLKLVYKIVDESRIQSLNVKPAATAFDQERRNGAKWLDINAPAYNVDGHLVAVEPRDDHEDVYDSDKIRKGTKGFGDCERLRIVMHLRQHPDFPEKLPVELCILAQNEVRIPTQTTPEAVEFVIRRVWERARAQPLPASPVDNIVSEDPLKSGLADVDFEAFARHYPDLAKTIVRMREWVKTNPTAEFLEPERLQRALGGGVSFADLAVAVGRMVEAGVLKKRYRVKPHHKRTYLPETFETIDQIVARKSLSDAHGNEYEVSDLEVVPVYGRGD